MIKKIYDWFSVAFAIFVVLYLLWSLIQGVLSNNVVAVMVFLAISITTSIIAFVDGVKKLLSIINRKND